MDEVVKIIRSHLIANNGLTLQAINREYKEDCGEPVPFASYGFCSLADFLRASGQFTAKKSAAGLMVTAKLSDSSAHIVKLRQGQNVSKSERKRKKNLLSGKMNASLARPAVRSNTINRTRTGTNTSTPKKNMSPLKRRPMTNNTMNRPSNVTKRTQVPNPRPPLVEISSSRPANTSSNNRNSLQHSSQNQNSSQSVQNSYPYQNVRYENSTQNTQISIAVNTRPTVAVNVPSTNQNGNVAINRIESPKNSVVTETAVTPSVRSNLYSRFPPKQLELEKRPKTPPESPPKSSLQSPSPIQVSLERNEITKPPLIPLKIDIHSRLIAKQPDFEPKTPISAPRPILTPSYTPMATPPTKLQQKMNQTPISNGKTENPARIDLQSRFPIKHLPVESRLEESTPSPVISSNRSNLFQKLQNILQEQNQKNQSINLDKPKTNGRTVSFKPQPTIIDLSSGDTDEHLEKNGRVEQKRDLHSRLQPKQTEFDSQMDQMSNQLNGVSLMEVEPSDIDVTDSQIKTMKTNGHANFTKPDLQSRLQKKQIDMDWEETSWTRSVNRSGNGVRITVTF